MSLTFTHPLMSLSPAFERQAILSFWLQLFLLHMSLVVCYHKCHDNRLCRPLHLLLRPCHSLLLFLLRLRQGQHAHHTLLDTATDLTCAKTSASFAVHSGEELLLDYSHDFWDIQSKAMLTIEKNAKAIEVGTVLLSPWKTHQSTVSCCYPGRLVNQRSLAVALEDSSINAVCLLALWHCWNVPSGKLLPQVPYQCREHRTECNSLMCQHCLTSTCS